MSTGLVALTRALPVESQTPTRNYIYNRFAKVYPGMAELLAPVFARLAEETERIILHLERGRPYTPVTIEEGNYPNGMPKIAGYVCPCCNNDAVMMLSNYCPQCGSPIQWRLRTAEIEERPRRRKKVK